MFAISNSTGEVVVVGQVDRERQSHCTLTLVAVDLARRGAVLPAYSRMRVTLLDVNDNAPRLTVTTLSPSGGHTAELRAAARPGTRPIVATFQLCQL